MDSVKRYEPKLYEGNEDIDKLFTANQEEVDKLHTGVQKILDNTILSLADINGIKKFEELYDIQENTSYTLEQRRTNLLNKISFQPPFTKNNLQQILEKVWGIGGYVFEIFYDTLEVIIDIDTAEPNIYLPFQKYIRDTIPANVLLILAVQYTHLYLKQNFTYGQMESLTYGELSQYADLRRNT